MYLLGEKFIGTKLVDNTIVSSTVQYTVKIGVLFKHPYKMAIVTLTPFKVLVYTKGV